MSAQSDSSAASRFDLASLLAKLSYALVAFTIEFDNAFESRFSHCTTEGPNAKSGRGPWLVSQPMWSNLVRFVGDGRPAQQLKLAIECVNLKGLQRWGYVGIRPGETRRDDVIFLKPGGVRARQVWQPLADEIEERWRHRVGAAALDRIKTILAMLVAAMPPGRPHHLPPLGFGLALKQAVEFSDPLLYERLAANSELSALLAQVLLGFQIEFERLARRSLCVEANLFPALSTTPVALKDLPRHTGLARPALAMAIKILERDALIDTKAAGARSRQLVLNAKGEQAFLKHQELVKKISIDWLGQHRAQLLELEVLLANITGPVAELGARLYEAIEPAPDGWRAVLKFPRVLPRFPAVSHRGGYPDNA